MVEHGRPVKRHASGSPRPVSEPPPDDAWRCVTCGKLSDENDYTGCGCGTGYLFRPDDPDNWKRMSGTIEVKQCDLELEKELREAYATNGPVVSIIAEFREEITRRATQDAPCVPQDGLRPRR
jgi:hypothetical protein